MGSDANCTVKGSRSIAPLDGLRAIACLLVVVSHAGLLGMFFRIPGTGQLGVMLFFSLSGFLMAHLYSEHGSDWRQWASYAIRRFFRVYPPYLVVVVIGFGIGLAVQSFVYGMSWNELFDHMILRGTVSVFWTIPVEMRFYLLFPVLCVIASRFDDRWAALFYGAVSVGLLFLDPSGEKYSLWPYAEFFVFGCCGAHVYRLLSWRSWVWDGLALLLLSFIILSIPSLSVSVLGWHHRLWHDAAIFAPLMAGTVMCCALSCSFMSRILSFQVLRWIGWISFSLYLTHFPILHFVRSFIPVAYAFVPSLALSLLVGWLSFALLERPSQRIGRVLQRAVRQRFLVELKPA